MAKFDMAAHVRRINSQDKIATGILTAIVGLVLLILAAIVIYILVAGAGKLFDVSFLTSKPQQFKADGGTGDDSDLGSRDQCGRHRLPTRHPCELAAGHQ